MHDIVKVTKIIASGFTLIWDQVTAPDHQVLLFLFPPNRWFFGYLA